MKILAIHDLAGFGRSSLTTIISIISSMGHQCVPAPTAIFSTHTAFEDYKMHDLTMFLNEYIEHYNSLNLKFEAIYSGFLNSKEQIDSVILACEKIEKNIVLIDPVMADDGKIYKTYTKEMCEKMKELIKIADIITPNITEVKVLLDLPLDIEIKSKEQVLDYCKQIDENKIIIITGIKFEKNKIITAYYQNGVINFYENPYIDIYFPGTGDLFASLLLTRYIEDKNLGKAVEFACEFVLKAIEKTIELGTNPLFGVEFESILKNYRQ